MIVCLSGVNTQLGHAALVDIVSCHCLLLFRWPMMSADSAGSPDIVGQQNVVSTTV